MLRIVSSLARRAARAALLATPTLTPITPDPTPNQVSTLAAALPVPVFCKIRLLDELSDTIAFCRQLQQARSAHPSRLA